MSGRFVVDSSVIVKWLNTKDENTIAQADKILADALQGDVELFAPELVKYEVGNVLLLRKKLASEDAAVPLHALFSAPVQWISETEDIARETFSIAATLNITYYDASFLALAKKYEAMLVTENIKHQGKSTDISVIALKDY